MTHHTFSSPRFVCRPASPRDTTDVKEFSKFTWEGHDYVQYVWDEWLADPEGLLAVAEFAGHAIGLAKITLLAPGQWWLEGFRVDPKFQGRKIGSHLHAYIEDWWLEHGDGIARLMTSSQRAQVHHLSEKFGYTKTGEVAGFLASPLIEPTGAFQLLQENEIPEALQFAERSPSLQLNNGLIDLGWRFVMPNPTTFQNLVKEKLAWWWRKREGLLLAWEDEGETPEDERLLAIGLLACQVEMLPEFLHDIRRLAGPFGYDRAFWIAPLRDELPSILNEAGYKREWDHPGFIYEKHHPLSDTVPLRP
jgi:GNAT superfamily N-acetyltransferase